MISINCKVLAYILSGMRRALSLAKKSEQAVVLTFDQQAATVRVANADVCIRCIVPASASKCERTEFAVPMRALLSLPESARQDMAIRAAESEVTFSTPAGGVFQVEVCKSHTIPAPLDSDSCARWRVSNLNQLARTLLNAASIADPESTRYSLGCIRLRGSDGQVAATDGRQVYAVGGYAFPFEEVMVQGAVIGRLKCLTDCSSISVGLQDEWLSLSTANGMYRWVIDLRIQRQGRFPNIDMCIPRAESSRTSVTIADADAEFLLRYLPHLIGKSEELNPMTLDLSTDRSSGARQVKLRFRRIDSSLTHPGVSPVIEVHLEESTHASQSMQVVMDHHHLLGALRFGHRLIHLRQPTDPVFCYGSCGSYVWAPMHESLTIGPTSSMQCFSTRQGAAAA